MKLPPGRRISTSLPTPAVSKPSAARRRARLRDPARKGAAISCFAKFCTRYAPCCSIGPEDSDANTYRCTGPAAPWVRRCFRRASGFDSMILVARLHPGPLSAASFSLCPPPNKGMHGALCLHQQRLLHHDWEASMPFIILGRCSPIPAPNILQHCLRGHFFRKHFCSHFCLGIALRPSRTKSLPKPSSITPQNLKRLTSSRAKKTKRKSMFFSGSAWGETMTARNQEC